MPGGHASRAIVDRSIRHRGRHYGGAVSIVRAEIDGRIPLLPRHRTSRIDLRRGAVIPPVALIRLALGEDPELLDAVAASGAAGAVVEVFGAGHAARRNAA
jgi:L-asparaginase/Glu-tRNA(Gln) amidotransferase subunit D